MASTLLTEPLAAPDLAATPQVIAPMASSGGGWNLRFADEFDGSGLDPTKWSSGFGWGDTSRSTVGVCDPDLNQVEDGVLVQRVERRGGGRNPFRVGCINSRDRFAQLYGYWEARMRAVGCRGSRAAFWAKPNDESWPPELDIVEVYGDNRTEAQFTNHWQERGRHRKSKDRFSGPNFNAQFHVFGAEWTPTEIIWYVDGVERFRTKEGTPYMNDGGAFYTMIEAQVLRRSSRCGEWPYYSAQYIDYVRIWQRPSPTGPPPIRPERTD